MAFRYQPGDRIGRLTLLRIGSNNSWWAMCDCGVKTVMRTASLSNAKGRGTGVSCGCWGREVKDRWGERCRLANKIWADRKYNWRGK